MPTLTVTARDKAGGTGTATASYAVQSAPAALKPRVAGLVVTDPTKLSNYGGVINHALDKAHDWAALEAKQGVRDFTAVHQMLDALPAGAFAKIVVDSGTHAPDWVKAWGNVTVALTRAGTSGTVPYFWTQQYVDAWCAFQDAMATEFDGDQRLKQVVYTGTMTENSEPFTLGGDDPSAVRLYNAGFRWDTEKSTMSAMLTHMLTVWPTTRVELALHSAWQYATATGIGRGTWSDIQAFVQPFVDTHGGHLITADYGLGPSDGPTEDPYTWMSKRGADSGYQLTVGSPYNADTRCTSVVNGIEMGGCYVEHASFSDGTDLDTGKTWTLKAQDAALKSNAAT